MNNFSVPVTNYFIVYKVASRGTQGFMKKLIIIIIMSN